MAEQPDAEVVDESVADDAGDDEGMNINDPDFFGEENLGGLGEEVGSLDPTLGDDGVSDDGVADADGVVDDGSGDVGDVDSEDAGDAPAEDGSEPEATVDDDGRPIDPVELRKWANQLQSKNDLLARQLEEAQAEVYDDHIDPQQIQEAAQRDPYEAFSMAMEHGQDGEALGLIAQTQADATEIAAAAQLSLAQSNAVEDAQQKAAFRAEYERLSGAARNATVLAEQMRAEREGKVAQAARAPLERRNLESDMNAAALQLRDKYGQAYLDKTQEMDAELRANPALLGDRSPQAILAGFDKAYKIVKDDTDIDKLVEAKVAEALQGVRSAKASAASQAQAEDSTRRVPSESEGLTEEQAARQGMGLPAEVEGSIGVKGFFDL